MEVSEVSDCRNCDKPIDRGTYCSTICEGMDRFPAPVDDYDKFTNKKGNPNE